MQLILTQATARLKKNVRIKIKRIGMIFLKV